MTINEGEKLRSDLCGAVYRVTAIRNKLVILDAVDGSSWMITGKDMLGMFFRKFRNGIREKGSSYNSELASRSSESM